MGGWCRSVAWYERSWGRCLMPLIKTPFSFAHCSDNLDGTVPSATPGANFSAGANNAMGSVVSVLGALAHDVHYLVIGLGGISGSALICRALLDVLLDPAGGTSWDTTNIFIEKLLCGYDPIPNGGLSSLNRWYHFPVYIKAGTSVGVRAQTSHTAAITSGRCVMYAFGEPSRDDMWWCGQKVESLGINAASSNGTLVTAGSTSVFGSWTNIAATGGDYGAVQFANGGLQAADTTLTAVAYYWQMGYGGAQLPGSPTIYDSGNTAETMARTGNSHPVFCDIPEGTTMQVRGTCSGSPEGQNVALYGVMA